MGEFFYQFPSDEPLRISEKLFENYGSAKEYTPTSLAEALGTEEWFLAYTLQSNGAVEDLNESSTYSVSISPDGSACVKNYTLTKNRGTGKMFTVEEAQQGVWVISGRLLTLELKDETLEFIISSLEHGVAQMIDPDYSTVSVFMTPAAFKVAIKYLFEA